MTEYVCEYCGLVAETIDHVPPVSIRPVLVSLKLDNDYPFITVRSCRECNGILGDRAFWTIDQRKSYLATRIQRKYKKYLEIPDWTSTELESLDFKLRQLTKHGLVVKAVTQKRLDRLGASYVLPNVDTTRQRYDPPSDKYRVHCKTCNKLTGDIAGFCSDLCEYAMTGDDTGLPKYFSFNEIWNLFSNLTKEKRYELRMTRRQNKIRKRMHEDLQSQIFRKEHAIERLKRKLEKESPAK